MSRYDYGLRQGRSRPLQTRSSSFISASGKEIVVDQDVAAKNDEILRLGKAVHKKLEEEIPRAEIAVDTETREERWGLRLINTLSWLPKFSTNEPVVREMEVFGIICNQVVVGVVDELVKLPQDSHVNSQCKLRLIDTKTRNTSSLPSDDDALPSRIQLMIYKTLLDSLLNISQPFDFLSFWERLGLDAGKTFSDRFIQQAAEILHDVEDLSRLSCLFDLGQHWVDTIRQLQLPVVDSTLQLIYRHRVSEATIGTKEFTSDDLFLTVYLEKIMEWWRGERKPQGVAVQHCGRCYTCEYKPDCEWREEQALELAKGRHRGSTDW